MFESERQRVTRVAQEQKPGALTRLAEGETAFHSRRLVGPAGRVLGMQQALGNQAVQQRASTCPAFSACPTGGACHTCPFRVQAKLMVGQPGDEYEREADRMAEVVMRMPELRAAEGAPFSGQAQDTRIQRLCPEWEEERTLQAKAVSSQTSAVTPDLEARLNPIRGGGQPLSASVRAFFEPRFGHDLSRVRIHTHAHAATMARAVNARAFTVGPDIMFGAGQYAPGASEGKRLLAHELTHVVQQQGTLPYWSGASSVIQLQPVDCTPPITGVAPPRNPTQEVIDAHNLAVTWAPLARGQVEAARRGDRVPLFVRGALDFHFATPNAANLTTIRNRFDGIIRRLARGTRIYHCNTAGSNPCSACGQPHPDAFQACSYCPSTGEFTRLCPPFFAEPASERALILVHEAAHARGACGDVYLGDANYPGPDPANNSESYAQFARSIGMPLGPIPLRPRVPTAPPSWRVL